MLEEFDENKWRLRIKSLPNWKRLLFGLSIAERMLPNYVLFTKESGWGKSRELRNSLDRAWSALENGMLDLRFDELAEECESAAPDTEDYDSVFTSSALDAANTVCEVLRGFRGFSVDSVMEIVTLSFDTIDMYIQKTEDIHLNVAELERFISNHELTKKEIIKQVEALDMLEKIGDNISVAVHKFRNHWYRVTSGSLSPNRARSS